MAFDPYVPKTPARIVTFQLQLVIKEDWIQGAQVASETVKYRLVVVDANGEGVDYSKDEGDALQHMTPAQRQAARQLAYDLKAAAVEAIIGT